MKTIDPKAIPRKAMQFNVPANFKFADSVEVSTGVLPFRMIGRSKEAVDHYYWGRIVHDLDGMTLRKSSITVDYCHSSWDVIGFANQFSVVADGLEIAGSLVSTRENDTADEIYRKGKAGVPWEASIDWWDGETELEYIPENVTTEVNGLQFAGPGYVVRKWTLNAMAICRYGVDRNTSTQFSQSEAETVSVSITTSSTENIEVTKPSLTAPAAGATPPAETQQFAQQPGTPAAGHISIEMLKQFSAEFGAKGTEFLTAGLTIDAARYQFAIHERDAAREELKQFATTVAAKDTEIADLKAKLMQFSKDALGQETPVGTDGKPGEPAKAPNTDPRFQQFALQGGDAKAALACAMKLKGT